jgi:hypothetical protein
MITRLQHKKSFGLVKRPLPLGEGWGEGLARTGTSPTSVSIFSLRFTQMSPLQIIELAISGDSENLSPAHACSAADSFVTGRE